MSVQPSVRLSVRPSVCPQSFSDLNEIWHVGIKVAECYMTVCHMTRSKVKVKVMEA